MINYIIINLGKPEMVEDAVQNREAIILFGD